MKLEHAREDRAPPVSPPSRGRGLKPFSGVTVVAVCIVAPFTGAWIETCSVQAGIEVVARRPLHGGVD